MPMPKNLNAPPDRPLKLGLWATALLGGGLALSLLQLPQQTVMAVNGPPKVPVDLGKALLQATEESDTYLAQVNNTHSIQVRSQVPGRILKVWVADGQPVRAGQALFSLDGAPQAATVASMQAMASGSRKEGPIIQKTMAGLAADRKTLLADLAFNQAQLARFQQLAVTQTIATKDVEQQQTLVTTLRNKLTALDNTLASQRQRLAQVSDAVNRDLANVKAAQATLAYYTVRAPFAGTIGQVIAKVGDAIDPSLALTSLTQGGAVQIETAIPVAAARAIEAGHSLRVLTVQGQTLGMARITFVAPKVDPTTQTVFIKANTRQLPLKADEKLRVQLVTGSRQQVVVPVEAIFRMIGQPFVYKAVTENGQLVARMQPITPGSYWGTQHQVVQTGLQPNQTIVVHGVQKLQDGVPIMDASTMPQGGPPSSHAADQGHAAEEHH
jgi:multidrug efflux pump subunit AcrA (membrane-fusion protein)